MAQLKRMGKDIKTGRHVFSTGIPNTKLVKTKEEQLLLFDGHHSMLASMAAGMTYLEEIPYMIFFTKQKDTLRMKTLLSFTENMRQILKIITGKKKR